MINEQFARFHRISILTAHGIETHQFEMIQSMLFDNRLVKGDVDGCFLTERNFGLVSFHGFGCHWWWMNGPGCTY